MATVWKTFGKNWAFISTCGHAGVSQLLDSNRLSQVSEAITLPTVFTATVELFNLNTYQLISVWAGALV